MSKLREPPQKIDNQPHCHVMQAYRSYPMRRADLFKPAGNAIGKDRATTPPKTPLGRLKRISQCMQIWARPGVQPSSAVKDLLVLNTSTTEGGTSATSKERQLGDLRFLALDAESHCATDHDQQQH